MSFAQYFFLALPTGAVLLALFLRLQRQGEKKWSILPKCGGTFLAFAGAVLAVWNGSAQAWPAVVFLGLCMVADGLLEVRFVPGMLCFAAAHGVLVWFYCTRLGAAGELPWPLLAGTWLLCVSIALVAFRKDLKTTGKLTPVFCLYPVVLGLLVGLAVSAAAVLHGPWPGSILAAVGMGCFFVSDLMVAKRFFHPDEHRWMELPIMVLYWGALYLVVASLWP